MQDSYNLRGSRGLSDFDARHRFVISGLYELPFHGNQLEEGWQLSTIVQSQSGNPVNIVVNNAAFTGTNNTVRPDVTGPIDISGRRIAGLISRRLLCRWDVSVISAATW